MKGYPKLLILTELVGFFVWENVMPRLNFGFTVFLFDITRWSVISPAEFRVMYTERSLVSTKIEFFRFDSLVLGARPKWDSKGVFLVSECIVNLRTYSTLLTLLRSLCSFSRLANTKFFSDWMVRSTNPVPVCRLAVPYVRSIFCSLHNSFYSLEIKAPRLSDFIRFGTPYSFIYSFEYEITVSLLVFLHVFATGHQLFLWTATKINGWEDNFLLCRLPVKSI